MNQLELHRRDTIDTEILYYVRNMQEVSPVTAENIFMFLHTTRRHELLQPFVKDRLAYLTSAAPDKPALLTETVEWDGGEVRFYRITAAGMDLLDGAVPPRNWRGKN